MSDDERRGAPADGQPPKPSIPARTQDPRRSGRGPVSTERLAHLDETLGFAPVEGEPPPQAPPPLPRQVPPTGLERRPPAAHRVSAAGKRATDLGLGELKRRADEAAAAEPPDDSTAVNLAARGDEPADEPTHAGQGSAELPSVLLSSGLVRAGDVAEPGTGTQTDHRRDLALEERVAAAKAARDRPPLAERREISSPLVRPNLRREGASDPGRAQVRGRGLTRRPARPEGESAGLRRPAGPPRAGVRAGLRGGNEPPRAGVRREPTGPRVGRFAIGEHPDEKTLATEGAATGRGPRKAQVRRAPGEEPRPGRVADVSARLQREPTDPSRATLPFEPEPSGRPMVAPMARRQREATDPGGRPVVAPLTRAQRETTDPNRAAVAPRLRRAKTPAAGRVTDARQPAAPQVMQREPTDPGATAAPPRAQREPTDPGATAAPPRAQREPTDPGATAIPPRSQRQPTGPAQAPPRAQRQPTDPAQAPPRVQRDPTGPDRALAANAGASRASTHPSQAPVELTHPELVPSALHREPTDPHRPLGASGRAGASAPTGTQREPTDPGLPSSALIVEEGTDATGRPSMTPPPMTLGEKLARLRAGGPGPGAARSGALHAKKPGPPAPAAQRLATVPAGAAALGSLLEARREEATESSASPVQREATVPVGAARAGILSERPAEAPAPEAQREPTTPHGAARKGALKHEEQRAPTGTTDPAQREPTAPKGAARGRGLRTAQSEATETGASALQLEATETAAAASRQEVREAPASARRQEVAETEATAIPAPPGPPPPDESAPYTPAETLPVGSELEATATHAAMPDLDEEPAPPEPPEPPRRNTAPLGSSAGQAVVTGKTKRREGGAKPREAASPDAPPRVRVEDVPPRLAHHTVTGVLTADERAGLLPASSRREPVGFFKTLSIVSMVLLFEAIALPTSRGAPWALLGDPGGVTFVALAFLLLVIVAHILPVRPAIRAGAALTVGVLMAAFSLVVAGAAARADLFDGQPAVAAALGGPAGGRVVLLLALMALPFGLFWRFLSPAGLGPKIAHGVGIALVVVMALASGGLGLGSGAAVAAAFDTLGSAPVFGDRMVAAFGLMPLLVALVSVAGFLPGGRGRRLVVFAVIFWIALSIPLVVAALFVSKSEAWMAVLEPLKVASFVAVPLLYLPAAAATFIATLRGRA